MDFLLGVCYNRGVTLKRWRCAVAIPGVVLSPTAYLSDVRTVDSRLFEKQVFLPGKDYTNGEIYKRTIETDHPCILTGQAK